jgi:cystathionine beta-synthase
MMKSHGISQLPVLNSRGGLAGILTEADVLAGLFDDKCTMDSTTAEVMCRRVSSLALSDAASKLAEVFGRGETALVLDDGGKLVTLLSKLDLIEFLAGGKKESQQGPA